MPYEKGVKHVVDLKSDKFCQGYYQRNQTIWMHTAHDVVPLLLLPGLANFLTLATAAHVEVKKA